RACGGGRLAPPRQVSRDHGFPLGVNVEGLGPRLTEAIARVLDPAKGHVGTRAVCRSVDRYETAAILRDEFLGAVHAGGVNRTGQSIARRVGEANGVLEVAGAIDAGDRTKERVRRDLIPGRTPRE